MSSASNSVNIRIIGCESSCLIQVFSHVYHIVFRSFSMVTAINFDVRMPTSHKRSRTTSIGCSPVWVEVRLVMPIERFFSNHPYIDKSQYRSVEALLAPSIISEENLPVNSYRIRSRIWVESGFILYIIRQRSIQVPLGQQLKYFLDYFEKSRIVKKLECFTINCH